MIFNQLTGMNLINIILPINLLTDETECLTLLVCPRVHGILYQLTYSSTYISCYIIVALYSDSYTVKKIIFLTHTDNYY